MRVQRKQGRIIETKGGEMEEKRNSRWLKFPQGPITRLKAKRIRARLNETIKDFITKTLDAHKTILRTKNIKISNLGNLGPRTRIL
ncbi:hypothetical protein J1N35_028997 [Gossypium stocksii]|uniref:Uncharacterized protein n=1 Tax=Gossypium stocksii TaxID=47602 RepID=A0A9D3UXD3_9ROSI|nr:hypothetical protein J1N35_028997 [Gossypium stocksii]